MHKPFSIRKNKPVKEGYCIKNFFAHFLVFHPAGPVAHSELHLIILSAILVAIVVVPVLVLLALIVIRYRDYPGNKAPYLPNWADSKRLEFVWWAIPVLIIGVLGFYTVKTTFALTRPPETNVKPLTIDVVSLDWKWVFLYPSAKIATVNTITIPTDRPIQFILTADAPMNSFWVPQLGGQEFTMPGMAMRLWLQANQSGTYVGRGANFTGKGFAHDTFNVHAMPSTKFAQWVNIVKQKHIKLTQSGYRQLRVPGLAPAATYSSYPSSLFSQIVKNDGGKNMHMKMGGPH